MIQELWETIRWLLGSGVDPQTRTLWQVTLRAIVAYLGALAMVRLGDKRLLGRFSVFDTVLAVILGSMVSRAINGSAPLVGTLGAGLALVTLHWFFAEIAFHIEQFGALLKGSARILIKDGEIRWNAMHRSGITETDLAEVLRLRGKLSNPAEVQMACLERSGEVSVIPRKHEPRAVVEVAVEAGVQTVRIEL
ncbi:MAG TPA: DUF421 domain-containing protein [Chloroflexi bacterium]|nr:DUF421 domain-containing protein [Chloroflexota bacterium]